MFLLRFVKKIVGWVILAFVIFWIANYKVGGKPVYQVVKGFFASGSYKEGIKDLRVFVGGFLKTVGEQIQEDVTEDEKKELDGVIQKQLREDPGLGNKVIGGTKK